jgi:hypothetical protein
MEKLLLILLYLNGLVVGEAPLTARAMDEFAQKMEPYYAEAGLPSHTGNAALSDLPAAYWGATVWVDGCTSQVLLSDRFTSKKHPFYDSQMWKYVLAHEWAHVAQGKLCWENETEAQLIALSVLADAGEWGAVITGLEWMFTLQLPEGDLDQLNLPRKEAAYYRSVDVPGTGIVELLLHDDDGVFELRTGRLDASNLWVFIDVLKGRLLEMQDHDGAS